MVERLDRGDFVFGAQLGADIRDVGLGRDRVRGACVVAGQHRDPDALFLQRSHRIGRSFAELIAHTDHRGWFVVDVQNHGGHAVFFKLGGVCAERAGAEPSWASDRDAVAVDPAFDAVAGLFRDVGCGGDHGCGGGDRGGDRVGAVLFEGGGPFQGDVHADVRDGADGGDLWFAAGEGPGLVDRDVADGSEPFECGTGFDDHAVFAGSADCGDHGEWDSDGECTWGRCHEHGEGAGDPQFWVAHQRTDHRDECR